MFLVCFVIAPLLVVLYYAFTNGQGQFTVQNFVNFFTSENTIGTLAYSLVTAMTVTAMLYDWWLSGSLHSGTQRY